MTKSFEKLLNSVNQGLARGIITQSEAETDLIFALSLEGLHDFPRLFCRVPEQWQQGIKIRFAEFRKLDFQWRPFFVGKQLNEAELERLRTWLRAVDSQLNCPASVKLAGQSDGPESNEECDDPQL